MVGVDTELPAGDAQLVVARAATAACSLGYHRVAVVLLDGDEVRAIGDDAAAAGIADTAALALRPHETDRATELTVLLGSAQLLDESWERTRLLLSPTPTADLAGLLLDLRSGLPALIGQCVSIDVEAGSIVEAAPHAVERALQTLVDGIAHPVADGVVDHRARPSR